MTTVNLVTRDATLDDLSMADYQAIYDELRPFDASEGKRVPAIRKFCEAIGWDKVPANWTNWEQGQGNLTRTMRNALRKAVGLPELPPTVADAVAVGASPDAAVWAVGEGVAEHVIMVADGEPVTLHVNGSVETVSYFPERLTCPRERSLTPVYRPMLDTEDHAALQGLQHKYTAKEIWRMGIKAARSLE